MNCAGDIVPRLSSMLLKLYFLRQPMLSRSTTDCLEMLCSAKNSHMGAGGLADLLQQVLHSEAAWDRKDADLVLGLTKLVETGFIRWAKLALHAFLSSYCYHELLRCWSSGLHQLGLRG